ATVCVTIRSVNDDPVAVKDRATTDEDTPTTIDVLVNDTDVDGDELSIDSVGDAAHGTVEIIEGQILYTPAPDYHGFDSFIVTIRSVNDEPVAVKDRATTDEDTPTTIDVLANDTDVDGDALTIPALGQAQHGSVALVNGKVLYTPSLNYHGGDSFTYTISDGQ